jgi:hypothetical protein
MEWRWPQPAAPLYVTWLFAKIAGHRADALIEAPKEQAEDRGSCLSRSRI